MVVVWKDNCYQLMTAKSKREGKFLAAAFCKQTLSLVYVSREGKKTPPPHFFNYFCHRWFKTWKSSPSLVLGKSCQPVSTGLTITCWPLGASHKPTSPRTVYIHSHLFDIHFFTCELWSTSFSPLIMGGITHYFLSAYHLFILRLILL